MKKLYLKGLIIAAVVAAGLPCMGQKFVHVERASLPETSEEKEVEKEAEGWMRGNITLEAPSDSVDYFMVRETEEIIASLPPLLYSDEPTEAYNAPFIFQSYRPAYGLTPAPLNLKEAVFTLTPDTGSVSEIVPYHAAWLDEATIRSKVRAGLRAMRMTYHPEEIEYLYSELPVPPQLMPAAGTFAPDVFTIVPRATAYTAEEGVIKITPINWLHILDLNLQFSQAYLSPNWYQGGNNSLTILAGFLWNVKLNPAYHPNFLFESNLQYKLGLYSTPTDTYHKYSISEDNLQWNAKAGIKAFKEKWFYSFTAQFKTPLLNNYEQNGPLRTAALLSPGDLNLGIGLTYTTFNPKRNLAFSASIAPISYNLKSCIDPKVDPVQFNIAPGAKTVSEIGSSAEVNLKWGITGNITYTSRLFLFSNYKYFIGDWENTVSFIINRFLSTQIYIHGRFDTSTDATSSKWKHWMLKEIFSFGFTYNFSTKIDAVK